MARYIDADKLWTRLQQYENFECPPTTSAFDAVAGFRTLIISAPTLTLDDLRPKGRWERDENGKVYCGVCKKKALEAREGVWFVPDFCPSCGADMRGGGEDG